MHIFVRDVYYQMHLHKCKRNRGLSARKIVKNQYLKTRMEYWSNFQWQKLTAARRGGLEFVESCKKFLKVQKNTFLLCSFLFLTNSKGILYKILRSVNECSVKKEKDKNFTGEILLYLQKHCDDKSCRRWTTHIKYSPLFAILCAN